MGENVAYPGVKTLNEEGGEKRRLHKYYQWVYFVLIIQVSFYFASSLIAHQTNPLISYSGHSVLHSKIPLEGERSQSSTSDDHSPEIKEHS